MEILNQLFSINPIRIIKEAFSLLGYLRSLVFYVLFFFILGVSIYIGEPVFNYLVEINEYLPWLIFPVILIVSSMLFSKMRKGRIDAILEETINISLANWLFVGALYYFFNNNLYAMWLAIAIFGTYNTYVHYEAELELVAAVGRSLGVRRRRRLK
jgi:hypothetical protein